MTPLYVLAALTALLLAAGCRSSLRYGDSQPGGGDTAGKGEPAPGRDTAAEAVSHTPPLNDTGSGAAATAPGPIPSSPAITAGETGASRGESPLREDGGAKPCLRSSPRPTVHDAPSPRQPQPWWMLPADETRGTNIHYPNWRDTAGYRPDVLPPSGRPWLQPPAALGPVGEWVAAGALLDDLRAGTP